MGSQCIILLCFISFLLSSSLILAQQPYIALNSTNCRNKNKADSVFGYACNGRRRTCQSFLIFRSRPPYNTVASIANHLASDPTQLASINSVPEDEAFETNKMVIVPVNCSCSGEYYQVNSSYDYQPGDTPFIIATKPYQGLTTCQAVQARNRFNDSMPVGTKITVPLRCACPTKNQTRHGVKFLLSYLVELGNNVIRIALRFGVDAQKIVDANQWSYNSYIYPGTTLLIPMQNPPTSYQTITPPPPPPRLPPPPPPPPPPAKGSKKRWPYVVISSCLSSVVSFALVFLIYICYARPRWRRKKDDQAAAENLQEQYPRPPQDLLCRLANVGCSLKVYEYEELQSATENFSPEKRIEESSVYCGSIEGKTVAIKKMERDIRKEIEVLKTVNHFNLIRLLGVSSQEGHWYLVYEYAENGMLSMWIHDQAVSKELDWVLRIQIAFDIANGLNYIHSYTNPAYVHMDITSSNILLDGYLRAKIAKFGMVRQAEAREGGFVLTGNVVGTQGYLAPEYLQHGMVSQKVDVYAFGVVMLELISGKEAVVSSDQEGDWRLLSEVFLAFFQEENGEEKLGEFIDPCLGDNFPMDLAVTVAQLIEGCLSEDAVSRPTMEKVAESLSRILAATWTWDLERNVNEAVDGE